MHTFLADQTAFPPEFLSFLHDNALPFPPVPQTLLPLFEQTDYNFFGTIPYFSLKNIQTLENLNTAELPENFVTIGIYGNLLQSRRMVYFLHYETILLGISLGWDKAYADPDFERGETEQAFKIAAACILNMPKQGKISVLINENGCFWQYTDNGSFTQGDSLAVLLDTIETRSQSEYEIPSYLWTRV